MSELEETSRIIDRIGSVLKDAADRNQDIRESINKIRKTLLIVVAVGSLVGGGLLFHTIGDYYRFDDMTADIQAVRQNIHEHRFEHKVGK